MDYAEATKKWRVLLELSNNKTSYDMVTMKELAHFIRLERQKSRNSCRKIRPMTPIEPWLLDIVFARFEEAFASTKIVSLEILPLRSI